MYYNATFNDVLLCNVVSKCWVYWCDMWYFTCSWQNNACTYRR